MTLRLEDERVVLRLPNVVCYSLDHEDTRFMIDVIDPYIFDFVQEFVQEDDLLIALQQEDHEETDSEELHGKVVK